jgi:hypothetical protein
VELKTDEAKSLKRFVELAINLSREDYTLYRGQKEDWPLEPKLSRVNQRNSGKRTDLENDLMRDFRNQALGLLEVSPTSEWDWLALAQHHGLATRLLDWTTNAMVALWFAVREPARAVVKGGPEPHGVVWVFNAKKSDHAQTEAGSDPYSHMGIKVFRPRHVTRRIVAQSGWFTIHGFEDSTGKFAVLPGTKRKTSRLARITIPWASFGNIREELARMGVGHAAMFPDLDGLCADILWNHTCLEDE